jgi:hypothetical protein
MALRRCRTSLEVRNDHHTAVLHGSRTRSNGCRVTSDSAPAAAGASGKRERFALGSFRPARAARSVGESEGAMDARLLRLHDVGRYSVGSEAHSSRVPRSFRTRVFRVRWLALPRPRGDLLRDVTDQPTLEAGPGPRP